MAALHHELDPSIVKVWDIEPASGLRGLVVLQELADDIAKTQLAPG